MKIEQMKLIQRVVGPGLLLAATFFVLPVAQAAEHDRESQDKDTAFIKHAAQSGLLETKVGQLAQQRGQSSEVKEFGEKLVKDHAKANAELMQIAQKKGIQIEKMLDEKHQAKLDKLSSASGAEFDKAFAKHSLKHHQMGISKYQQAAAECEDPQLKKFAQSQLPTLQEHLRTAQNMARTVGLSAEEIAEASKPDASETEAVGGAGTGTETQRERQQDQQRQPGTQPDDQNRPGTGTQTPRE